MALLILALGIIFIIVAIAGLKMHPFLALILAAILTGLLSPVPLTSTVETRAQLEGELQQLRVQLEDGRITVEQFDRRSSEAAWEIQERWLDDSNRSGGQAVLALELTASEFGSTAAAIGIVIVLAALIGQCLMDSGAADKITRSLLRLFGEPRAPLALLGSGYVLSVPVFFDTVFFLLIPLARALRMRTGKKYVLYVIAIATGGVITHSLVPPTPGPLIMAETLPGLQLGTAIALGFLLGLIPAVLGGFVYAGFVDRRLKIPFREVAGSSQEELEAIVHRPEKELPGLIPSLMPVVLPVLLITGDTILQSMNQSGTLALSDELLRLTAFLGNKNFALLVAAFVALWLLVSARKLTLLELRERMEPAILSAGVIILITSAGGAFGRMLSRTGISAGLQDYVGDSTGQGFLLILLAFGLSSLMKIAQGSGTVAMITSSAMMAAVIGGSDLLPFHPIYIFAAIGFGSLVVSWMNDSAFWVICKMSGFTERETLATWTSALVVTGFIGLLEVLLLSTLFPLA